MDHNQTSYRYGHQVEDVLVARLQKHGFDVLQNEELNHAHKLDFVVQRFDGIAQLRPIGVQVTMNAGHAEKIEQFLAHQDRHPYTPRALYIELENVDVDAIAAGVDLIVYSAIVYFAFADAFSETHGGKCVHGFRVRKNWTTEFFDLRSTIEQLRKAVIPTIAPVRLVAAQSAPPRAPAHRVPTPTPIRATATVPATPATLPTNGVEKTPRTPSLGTPLRGAILKAAGIEDERTSPRCMGTITKLNSHGYGFLDDDVNGKRYFFSISDVRDHTLRDELERIKRESGAMWAEHLRIPVTFQNRGKVRSDAAHPLADHLERRIDRAPSGGSA